MPIEWNKKENFLEGITFKNKKKNNNKNSRNENKKIYIYLWKILTLEKDLKKYSKFIKYGLFYLY